MPDFSNIIGELGKFFGGGAAGVTAMRFLFRIEKDLEICKTRFMQKTPGWPWAGQIAIHRTKSGWDMQYVEPGGTLK